MDGWESRRKRGEGYDYCVVRLGLAGTIAGVDIDTSFFTGNFPPSASIDACYSPQGEPTDSTEWQEILPSLALPKCRGLPVASVSSELRDLELHIAANS